MDERAQARERSNAERRPRRSPASHNAVAVVLAGLVGAWLGMSLFARTTVQIGPFRVELQTGFGRGETVLAVPPFGALTADTHLAPLGLSATLMDVGVQRLTDVVNRRGTDGLVADVERDARERLRPLAWRGVLAATTGGVAVGLLAFRRRWRLVVLSGGAAFLTVVGCVVLVQFTFRPSAFTEPRYSGSLALAPKLIGPVREATDRIGDLRAGLTQIVDGTVRAYTTLQSAPLAEDAIRVLHISDIHASVLGMDFAQEVARGFDVDIVVDTGDITSFATSIEDLIASEVPGFGRPYVFVRGSHDSLSLQEAIARQSNAVVLDGRFETIEGLTLYGLGHPAFTPARGEPVDEEAFEEAARSAGAVISGDLDAAEEPVDIVAVHDDRMAEAVAGRVPLVISGHFHETTATVRNGTLFLRISTTGGSGAGTFRDLAVPFSAEVLYFSGGSHPELLAYDVIEQLPASGSLSVQRVNVVQEFGQLSPTPSPSQPASASESLLPEVGSSGSPSPSP